MEEDQGSQNPGSVSIPLDAARSQQTKTQVSWAQIVEDTKNQVNTKLDFFEPLVIDGKPVVAPPEEVFEEGSVHWRFCLVGNFVGKRPAFQ